MYKFIIAILSVFILTGCATKSPTQAIVNSGVEQIERAERIVKNAETLKQCQEKAADSLLTAKSNLINAGESCAAQISKIESDLIQWKTYFWLLITGIGATIYLVIIKKLRKGII